MMKAGNRRKHDQDKVKERLARLARQAKRQTDNLERGQDQIQKNETIYSTENR